MIDESVSELSCPSEDTELDDFLRSGDKKRNLQREEWTVQTNLQYEDMLVPGKED